MEQISIRFLCLTGGNVVPLNHLKTDFERQKIEQEYQENLKKIRATFGY